MTKISRKITYLKMSLKSPSGQWVNYAALGTLITRYQQLSVTSKYNMSHLTVRYNIKLTWLGSIDNNNFLGTNFNDL